MNAADDFFVRATPRRVLVAALVASLALLAGCGKDDKRRPGAAAGRSDRTDRHAARRAGQLAVRRADAELAGGEHRRARVGLPRQARVRRRLGGQGRPGAVPDGPEAVPGAGRRRGRRAAAKPGGDGRGQVQPRAHQAARPAECAVAEGPGRRAGAVRAVRRRRRAVEGAARIGAARPLLHDDRLAGRRRQQLRRGRRRHLRQSAEQPADDGLRADADVDQLQRLRERDGAHPRPGAEGAADASRGSPVHRGDRIGRRFHVPVQGQDHVRRSFVQLADGHVSHPRVGGQPEGRAASQPVRAHAARTARSGRTRSSSRSAPCSRARRDISSGS